MSCRLFDDNPGKSLISVRIQQATNIMPNAIQRHGIFRQLYFHVWSVARTYLSGRDILCKA